MSFAKGPGPGRVLARKLASPLAWARLARLGGHERHHKVDDDAQLQLFAKVSPSDFLHYGYFDDPDIAPERISFHDLEQAQLRYGELVLEQLRCPADDPVLDAGCGMGGLLRLLKEAGRKNLVALTPDRSQLRYVAAKHPDVRMEHCRLEQLDTERYAGRFGAVITSESFQYMEMDAAFAAMAVVMKPGARWVLIDYFRAAEDSYEKSGHMLDAFRAGAAEAGFRLAHERDITAHVLPTMRFGHLLGTRLGAPLVEYLLDKVEQKQPRLHYLLEEWLAAVRVQVREQVEIVRPEVFARDKRYMLFVLERA